MLGGFPAQRHRGPPCHPAHHNGPLVVLDAAHPHSRHCCRPGGAALRYHHTCSSWPPTLPQQCRISDLINTCMREMLLIKNQHEHIN